MPRNPSGVYSLPSGSIVATGDTVLPSQHNNPLNDVVADLNLARPISAGGTGGTTALEARENLSIDTGRTPSGGESAAYLRMLTSARWGEPLHLVDIVTRTQAEGIQEHTITDDLSGDINTLLTDDRAINVRLPSMGLIPIGSTIEITESQYSSNGLHFGSANQGRARPVGGKADLIIQKMTGFSGFAIDVNPLGTTAIQKVHLTGFLVDGQSEAGGGVRIRYAQDVRGQFTVDDDAGDGIVFDGVWNSQFYDLMAKTCQSSGFKFNPITRENSNLSFYDPWAANCGGDGEVYFKYQAGNANAVIQMFNPLIEAVLATGATDSPGMMVIESAKRLDVFGGIITSPDGRNAHCLRVDGSLGGDQESISFTSTDFNNTGSKVRDSVIDMIDVPTDAVQMINPGKKGNDKFADSNAGTSAGALTVIGGRNIIAAATDVSDLSDQSHLRLINVDVDIGNKGSAASATRIIGTTPGKGLNLGATGNGGAEKTVQIDPVAETLHLNDYQIILKNTTAPSSATDTGTTGEIRWAGNFIYVCTSADTWKRVAIATW